MLRSILIIASLIFICCCSNAPIYNSAFQDKPFTDEPNVPLMPMPLRYSDPDSKLQYTFSNDLENIYVCIKATEDEMQTKMVKAGMQIWIDTTGKKQEQVGIMFPLVRKNKKDKSSSENQEGYTRMYNNNSHKVAQFSQQTIDRARLESMDLSGFKSPIDGLVPLHNEYGIIASMSYDSVKKILTYKAIIPLKTFTKAKFAPIDSTKKYTLTVIVNAMSPQGGGNRGGNRGSGGGGMGGGAGMGGGLTRRRNGYGWRNGWRRYARCWWWTQTTLILVRTTLCLSKISSLLNFIPQPNIEQYKRPRRFLKPARSFLTQNDQISTINYLPKVGTLIVLTTISFDGDEFTLSEIVCPLFVSLISNDLVSIIPTTFTLTSTGLSLYHNSEDQYSNPLS